MEDKKRTWRERGMIVSLSQHKLVSGLFFVMSRTYTRDWVIYVQLNVSTETDPQAELAGRCREVSLRVKRIDKTPERTVVYCGQVQAACDRVIDSGFVSDWLGTLR